MFKKIIIIKSLIVQDNLSVFALPLKKKYAISVSRCLKIGRSRIGTSVVMKAKAMGYFIIPNSYSTEDKRKYQRTLFGVVCFTTSKWAYQQLLQIIGNAKR